MGAAPTAYELLFSHPPMVADLLEGYLASGWIDELDLAGLEPVPAVRFAEGLTGQRDGCIWRLPWGDPSGAGRSGCTCTSCWRSGGASSRPRPLARLAIRGP